MITDEDKEKVREATDVLALVSETVELRRRGVSYWGCCPFHHEKNASFHVDPHTGFWKCFGCGEAGDIFTYVMRRESLEFPDAIRYLADRAGIELTEERGARRGPKRNRLVEALTEAERFYNTMLMRGKGEGPAEARHYLAGRGFGSDVCRRWGLGYAPGRGALIAELRKKGFSAQELVAADLALAQGRNLRDRFYERVMFPIHDRQGRTIAFGGRVLGDAKPKYLNTKETSVFHKSKQLFAFDRAKDAMTSTGEAIVCEGYTDVIAMHEAGLKQVVAALGTSFSEEHVKSISSFASRRIICLFDGDAAGQRAAERAVQFIDKTKLEMVCVVLPGGLDPAEYLAEHGVEELRQRLAEAKPLMDFVFERRLSQFDLTVPGQRVAAMESIAEVLAPLVGSMLLDSYVAQLSQTLGVDEKLVRQRVQQAARKASSRANSRRAPEEPPAQAPQENPYAQTNLAVLSADERFQIRAERELLSMMATQPNAVRAHAERMASFTWADPQHEAMAWAMLATPEGASQHDVIRAAERVNSGAAALLAGGEVSVLGDMSDENKVAFLLDLLEIATCRREIRAAKLRLQASSDIDETSRDITRQIMELSARIGELSQGLAASAYS